MLRKLMESDEGRVIGGGVSPRAMALPSTDSIISFRSRNGSDLTDTSYFSDLESGYTTHDESPMRINSKCLNCNCGNYPTRAFFQ
mmetsp:Transcript_12551/g.18956  ORF Transcript_12551/g.18956 Transcript_12551/m.18956 type:complete len:85 (+) Transcript_12551:146-400(+)